MKSGLDLIIQGGRVVLQHDVQELDIGIKDGIIVQLGKNLQTSAREVFNARGLVVMPGMIDVHVHLDEPGLGDWEGFLHGSMALAAGGVTTYFDMPLNGVPPTTTAAALYLKEQCALRNSYTDYAFWGGLVPENLPDIADLNENGVIAFKAFMSSPAPTGENSFREVDDVSLYEGMKEIAKYGKILALHAESEQMTQLLAQQKVSEGRTGARDYEQSRPIVAELEAVQRALTFAEETGCKLHFVHISSRKTVELIQRAKQRGMDVTLETCPHYLTLNVDDVARIGPVAKCAPPIREQPEVDALWEMMSGNRIDMISSDHSPCPTSMKQSAANIFEAWGGISGGQFSMELIVEEAHLQRNISLPQVARWLSAQPAKRFGLYPKKGEIRLFADADFALIDLNREHTLSEGEMFSKHKHNPYAGRRHFTKIVATYVRGNRVYDMDGGFQQAVGERIKG